MAVMAAIGSFGFPNGARSSTAVGVVVGDLEAFEALTERRGRGGHQFAMTDDPKRQPMKPLSVVNEASSGPRGPRLTDAGREQSFLFHLMPFVKC